MIIKECLIEIPSYFGLDLIAIIPQFSTPHINIPPIQRTL